MFAIPGLNFPVDLNLRNGNANNISPATRSAAIPAQFHWPAWDIPDGANAIAASLVVIKDAFGRIGATRVVKPRQSATHNIPGNAVGFDATPAGQDHTAGTTAEWQATVDAANANAELRTSAIALGATRVGLAAYWRVTALDIRGSERSTTPTGEYIPGAPASAGGPGVRARFDLPAGQEDLAGTIAIESALAHGMTDLTDVELELATACVNLAAAAFVLAGCELLETGHHYLSSNLAPTKAVENQVLSTASDAMRGLWNGHVNAIRDMVWHKAAHPLSPTIMVEAATDMAVKERLMRANLGSAAVRLPYVESTIRGARAMVALHSAVSASVAEAGYVVEIPRLVNALAYVETYNAATAATAANGIRYPSRFAAIEEYLRVVMDEAGPFIAWCGGMYKGICEEATAGVGANTLLKGYSIRRVLAQHVGSVASGATAYDNYKRFTRQAIKDGKLPGVTLIFDEAGSQVQVSLQPPPAAAPPVAMAPIVGNP